MYISIHKKLFITFFCVILFTIICSIIEIPWWNSLAETLNPILATVIIIGLAFLPGIMISFTLCGIILDKPRRPVFKEFDNITILIAAYNEEECIYDTIKSIAHQDFERKIIVYVIDNNSKDNTKQEIFRAQRDFKNISVKYLFEQKQGKFAALNCGLALVQTKYVITIDADTILHKDAIKNLVGLMVYEDINKPIGAIAGTVLVRNSRHNLLTKMQEWEYFLSIAGIKRMQGLFQAILVAQGAFSIYSTTLLNYIGGWSDSIGEDIVLTWRILQEGFNTYYCDDAIAFTNAPTKLRIFCRQRARWARGMIEGFRHFSFKECQNKYARIFIFMDLFLFLIDLSVTIFYIPGLIAAIIFRNYLIVGPMTLYLMPITILLFLVMFISEYFRVFKYLKLKVRKHYIAFIFFMLTYSIILSPVCVWGYIQEFFKTKRIWK